MRLNNTPIHPASKKQFNLVGDNKQQAPMTAHPSSSKMSNLLLNDYEKTKLFNNQVMKNIGSPKGPLFARINL